MRRLPDSEKTVHRCGDLAIVGAHVNEQGYVHYNKFRVSDLPNDLVSRDDLERVLVDVVDVATI